MDFKKVLVGLSGGIDSALVTYIAVQAVGKENVHVVLMPSKYSSEGSVTIRIKLVENLGYLIENLSIQPIVDKTLELLSLNLRDKLKVLTEENLQARIRGIIFNGFFKSR